MTDGWGDALYQLWLDTNKGAPIPMVSDELTVSPFVRGDTDADEDRDLTDYRHMYDCLAGPDAPIADGCECMDFDGDNHVDIRDFLRFQNTYTGS